MHSLTRSLAHSPTHSLVHSLVAGVVGLFTCASLTLQSLRDIAAARLEKMRTLYGFSQRDVDGGGSVDGDGGSSVASHATERSSATATSEASERERQLVALLASQAGASCRRVCQWRLSVASVCGVSQWHVSVAPVSGGRAPVVSCALECGTVRNPVR
jgi:hypothetical protein